jgi:hypothetical protein
LGPVAAFKNSRNSAPVRVGKYFVECATISVCALRPFTSGRWKRIAMPRGLPVGSVSGSCGVPVDEEKRTVIGVEEALKCGADVRLEAAGVGVKVPVRSWPFACAVGFVRFCLGWNIGQWLHKGWIRHTWSKAWVGSSYPTKNRDETVAGLDYLSV